jgi:hypothetical protein
MVVVTEHDHDARQAERTARRRRHRRRLLATAFMAVLGLSAAAWWLYYQPLTAEEMAFVGRWDAPQYTLRTNQSYEWEFKSNHTVRRRILVNGKPEPATEQELGWSAADGKLTLVIRHADWVSRLKSGNTRLTETGEALVVWDGPDRFSFAPLDPNGRVLEALVLAREPEPGGN